MRWGSGDAQFVRPVHGLVMLHGNRVVPGKVLGIESGNRTRGHRFMSSGEIVIPPTLDVRTTAPFQHWRFATYGPFRLLGVRCTNAPSCPAGYALVTFSTPVRTSPFFSPRSSTSWPGSIGQPRSSASTVTCSAMGVERASDATHSGCE